MDKTEAFKIVTKEYDKTTENNPKFNSAHEGFAILKEEVDELWDEIKNDSPRIMLRDEVKQVAAMALRFLTDCC